MQNIKYKDLVGLFSKFKKKQIYLLFICSLEIIAESLFIYQIQSLVDSINNKVPFYELKILFCKICFLGFISFFITLYETKKWHSFRFLLINNMRFKMYLSLFKKDCSFFDSNTTGDLTSKVLNDGSPIAENAGINVLMIILNLFKVLLVLVMLFTFSIKLTLIVIIILPVYYLLIILSNGKMRLNSKEERIAFARVQENLIENIQGFKEIKTLNKYDYFADRYDTDLNKNYYSKLQNIINCEVLMYAIKNLMTIFLPLLILILGSYLAYNQEITIGVLIAFYTYIYKLVEPIGNLADSYQGSKKALGSADRVYDFIFSRNDTENSIVNIDNIDNIKVDIKTFSWSDKQVLKNVSFELNKGDRLFINGPSGCGKSTLLKLLLNLYELPDGQIVINNENLRNISKLSLYNKMSILFQDSFIFRGSIRENLTLGDYFSDKDILDASKIACIYDFIVEKGLDYVLLESGSNISGGQKQRLALARILLRKPNVLLLDESTSALDSTTENKLLNNLNQYLTEFETILIVVSHNHTVKRLCNKEIILT